MTAVRAAEDTYPGRPSSVWFLLVIAVALIAYSHSFTVPFQFDDHQQILENPAVREPSWSTLVTWGRTRIIPTATLALSYRIGGENVLGYHVVNLAIHLLACWWVFQLALELCRTPRLRGTWVADSAPFLALATAVLFACHPIQVQAVTYIVQRMSSLAACFYIGAVLYYVRARNVSEGTRSGRAFLVSAGLALAAFLSKENSASLPLAILLAELVLFPAREGTLRRVLPFATLMLVVPVTFFVLSQRPQGGETDSWIREGADQLTHVLTRGADAPVDVSPVDYLRTQFVVIPRYLRLILLPVGLNIDHDVPVARSFFTPEVALGFVLILALLACGLYATRHAPLIGFGLLWIFVALSVESSFFPIRDVMNEHRVYLAMPGAALVLAFLLVQLQRIWPRLALGIGTAVMVVLTALTIARNEKWQSAQGLWQDALTKSPRKARPHLNLGTALHLQGDVKGAIEHYCDALALEPTNQRAESNINIALDQLVEDGEAEMVIAAREADGSMELEARHPCPGGRKSSR